jgi:hypothetical protein
MEALDLTPHTINGLRPRADVPRGAPYMNRYTNLMACERRAKQLPTMTWPVGFPTVHTAWPLADVFHKDRVALAVVNNAFKTINVSALTNAAVTLYDAVTPANPYTVSGTGGWHFAAFLDSWFATNGTSLVYSAPSTASNKTVGHHSGFACTTVANWNNRLVIGGLSGSRLSATSFTKVLALWRRRNKMNVISSEDDSFDTTWLLIGPLVGGDSSIPNGALLGLLGLPSDTVYQTVFEAQMLSWVEQGVVDLLPLRHTGAVQNACQYGGDLLVIGAEGASLVRDTEIGPVEQQACPIGGWGRMARGGETHEQLFLGKDGNAYMVGEGAQRYVREGVYAPEMVGYQCYRLGWSEYLGALTASEATRIAYDPAEQRYWLTDGVTAYLLSRTGLSRSSAIRPSAVVRLPGQAGLIGAYDPEEYVQTGDFASGTGWTPASGWVIGGGEATATASGGILQQVPADFAVAPTAGVLYGVTFTVGGPVTGGFAVALNGGTASATISTAGTHTVLVECGSGSSGLTFTPTSTLTCTLDDVSMVTAVDLRTVAFDLGRRDPFTVARLDLTTSDTASSEHARWRARMHAKLRKQDALTTFDWTVADVRGAASVELSGVEHEIELAAADRTAVDLDAAVAWLDLQKNPDYRPWLDTV